TLDNARLGVVPIANGGTGSATQNFVDLTTAQTNIAGDKTFTATLSGNAVNSATQFNLGGARILGAFGTDNTVVGLGAGRITTGTDNSFFGTGSGFFNVGGSFNSFFGESTGFNNSSGAFNSFFGASAGFSNSSGAGNSFFGSGAGSSTQGGGSNVFLGNSAGNVNVSGSNNTIIGANTNVAAGNLDYTTVIGAGASSFESNSIVLGRNDASDTVRIPGKLKIITFGAAGSSHLCFNSNLEVATCSSSLRYKTNIAPFTFGLSLINQLQPISFDWKTGGMKDVGFGAETVAAINPLFVNYNAAGEVEGVKYDRLSVLFVNAFKEQQTQISEQQTQIIGQQTQIQTQQKQLDEQKALIDGLRKLVCANNPTAAVCQ
ncbi:MAG: tail fiber domain-containing protein, partial [Pyrinomonadaceae bacterium]|nr:tail fiber domain-containing protein [Pyrinomonadaceae bacterium]